MKFIEINFWHHRNYLKIKLNVYFCMVEQWKTIEYVFICFLKSGSQFGNVCYLAILDLIYYLQVYFVSNTSGGLPLKFNNIDFSPIQTTFWNRHHSCVFVKNELYLKKKAFKNGQRMNDSVILT